MMRRNWIGHAMHWLACWLVRLALPFECIGAANAQTAVALPSDAVQIDTRYQTAASPSAGVAYLCGWNECVAGATVTAGQSVYCATDNPPFGPGLASWNSTVPYDAICYVSSGGAQPAPPATSADQQQVDAINSLFAATLAALAVIWGAKRVAKLLNSGRNEP